jgi:hypothetical protein
VVLLQKQTICVHLFPVHTLFANFAKPSWGHDFFVLIFRLFVLILENFYLMAEYQHFLRQLALTSFSAQYPFRRLEYIRTYSHTQTHERGLRDIPISTSTTSGSCGTSSEDEESASEHGEKSDDQLAVEGCSPPNSSNKPIHIQELDAPQMREDQLFQPALPQLDAEVDRLVLVAEVLRLEKELERYHTDSVLREQAFSTLKQNFEVFFFFFLKSTLHPATSAQALPEP